MMSTTKDKGSDVKSAFYLEKLALDLYKEVCLLRARIETLEKQVEFRQTLHHQYVAEPTISQLASQPSSIALLKETEDERADKPSAAQRSKISEIRKSVTAILQQHYDDFIFESMGFGRIIARTRNREQAEQRIRILVKHSQTPEHLDFPSGWFMLSKEQLDYADLFIFTITFLEQYHYLIVTKKEMTHWLSKKRVGIRDVFHLLLNKREEWFDERDGTMIACSEFENRWDALKRSINDKFEEDSVQYLEPDRYLYVETEEEQTVKEVIQIAEFTRTEILLIRAGKTQIEHYKNGIHSYLRRWWRLNKNHLTNILYVVGMVDNEVSVVYKPERWEVSEFGRSRFVGVEVTDSEIWKWMKKNESELARQVERSRNLTSYIDLKDESLNLQSSPIKY
jgi:hypothetical protein